MYPVASLVLCLIPLVRGAIVLSPLCSRLYCTSSTVTSTISSKREIPSVLRHVSTFDSNYVDGSQTYEIPISWGRQRTQWIFTGRYTQVQKNETYSTACATACKTRHKASSILHDRQPCLFPISLHFFMAIDQDTCIRTSPTKF